MNSEPLLEQCEYAKTMPFAPKRSRSTRLFILLVSSCARCLLVFLQAEQELPEPRLFAARRTALGTLSAQIDQLGDALPACAARSGVIAICEKLLGLFLRLGNLLVFLVVVVLVEVVDVLLRLLDGVLLAVVGNLVAVLDLEVASLAPFPDDIGLW
jgi:hypothetical protein